MKISEDAQLKKQFIDKLQEKCAPVRTEIHVSDLTYCLRKAFWRRFENRKLSEHQLIFFLDGHQRHEGLQSLVDHLEHEKEVRKYGIVGHLDLADGHPIEIKTTRARPNGQKPQHYIQQCAYYCLLTESKKCNLITQYINDGLLTFETIEFSQQDLDAYLKEMLEARDRLQNAYDSMNPKTLPFLRNWQCNHCEFVENCEGLE